MSVAADARHRSGAPHRLPPRPHARTRCHWNFPLLVEPIRRTPQTRRPVSNTRAIGAKRLPGQRTHTASRRLLCCVQDALAMARAALPHDSYEHVARTVFEYAGGTIMGLFLDDEAVPEYNMFALYRLHGDLSGIAQFADSIADLPRLRVGPAWPVPALTLPRAPCLLCHV
jgi:hypothetical protein